ncbi:ribosome small subunit-dependent GTPase A [Pseudalkalibacillus berkeleyi]|uniref:Small ribosomal subunit biogenesis GTPase RsgA n=1 Tax=Pseudalkalibacillus berkeleyi TaxID=1069813 RepID=A0ABS9GW82_9BACL|nr:ribosome small subunit-dependent GTPase A [Pseudalkalibacillus berkeleyi]MCF6137059.1 ribosome small subunit-dependent GTPase A [Pseudalkalibacillus berkeleyi]
MAKGTIIKALSGFYYVKSEGEIYQCRGRGNFRKRKLTPLVGDDVVFESSNKTDGYVLELMDRKNELVRPPIANVDQALIIFSALEPTFSTLLLDRFLVHIEANEILPVICLSKLDLLKENENVNKELSVYRDIGYNVLETSSIEEKGLEDVRSIFEDKVTVIAGQSGVGKSTLLNALNPELNLETNAISNHLGRGKHTTRHVELIPFGEGLVADTPGFSSLDFVNMEPEDLSIYFPEMRDLRPNCKFRGCTHTSEPKCAVKDGLSNGEVSQFRYDHYVQFLEEIKDQKQRRY